MRPLRIAFIGGRGIGACYSGIETYYEEVGSRLTSYGHTVFAYCRRHFTTSATGRFGRIVPVFQPCLRTKHAETFTHTLASTIDVLFRSVDIVQFHALGPSLFSGIPRLRGIHTVASIRGLDWQREKWGILARNFLRFSETMSSRLPDAVSVVSRTLQRHYLDHHGVSATYIPNGVNPASTPAPQPSEIRKLGLLGRDYFLFVGRLSPEKGCDVLIDAYRGLAGRAKLAIAGGSSYSDAYVKRLRASTPPGVLFLGPVRGRLLSELYAHAAAFVLPSTIEGLSVSLLEAMAHGCCVIASNIPENLELAGDAGWTVPPKDVAALGAALSRVLEQPAEAARLGNLARRRVEAEYTWDRTARRTEALFYELLGRPVEKDVDSTLPASPAEDGRIPAA